MKIAIKTRTETKDYDWYSADSSFKRSADTAWLKWHNEVYDGAWFGLTNQDGQMFFLAGKIPTRRKDLASRNILDFVVMQPETDDERTQLARLTSDLLNKRQDISSVDSPFDQWADDICVSMAEKGSYDYTQFPTPESSLSSESKSSIGSFEYPLNGMKERERIADALGSLLKKNEDFLVGCIQYPVERFIEKLGDTLLYGTQIAVFSAKTDSKKKVTVPFSIKNLLNNITLLNPSNNMSKKLQNQLAIGLLFLILFTTFCLGYQNSQKATQIQNLNNQISSIEAALEKTSNELAAKIQEVQQTIQRYEAAIQAKDAEIDKLKKQINSSKESPPQETPAQDSGSSVE